MEYVISEETTAGGVTSQMTDNYEWVFHNGSAA